MASNEKNARAFRRATFRRAAATLSSAFPFFSPRLVRTPLSRLASESDPLCALRAAHCPPWPLRANASPTTTMVRQAVERTCGERSGERSTEKKGKGRASRVAPFSFPLAATEKRVWSLFARSRLLCLALLRLCSASSTRVLCRLGRVSVGCGVGWLDGVALLAFRPPLVSCPCCIYFCLGRGGRLCGPRQWQWRLFFSFLLRLSFVLPFLLRVPAQAARYGSAGFLASSCTKIVFSLRFGSCFCSFSSLLLAKRRLLFLSRCLSVSLSLRSRTLFLSPGDVGNYYYGAG